MQGLKRKILAVTNQASGKIKTIAAIVKIAEAAKHQGKVVVTTNGCFDLLHIGHVRNLEKAKSLGDLLIVGVNSDKSVRKNKGSSRPIVPEKERAEVLAGLKAVDYVFIFNEQTPIPWLKKLKPNIHVKGRDRTPKGIIERGVVEKNNGHIVLVTYIKGKSTTNIIKKVLGKTL